MRIPVLAVAVAGFAASVAAAPAAQQIEIDAKYVEDHLGNLAKDEDLSRYIL